jgi:hypothetical protein
MHRRQSNSAKRAGAPSPEFLESAYVTSQSTSSFIPNPPPRRSSSWSGFRVVRAKLPRSPADKGRQGGLGHDARQIQSLGIYLGIELSTQSLREFCAVLNEFALPRAIVDFERDAFVAWNPKFLEQSGYSEDEIKSAKPGELLTFADSWFPLSSAKEGQTVEFISSAAKRAFGSDPAPGYVVRSHGKIGYVMLDTFDLRSVQFGQGKVLGREEERTRIVQAYHEEVSSSMIAALFLIETAKSELQEADLPQAEAVAKASDMLKEATDKLARVLTETSGLPT